MRCYGYAHKSEDEKPMELGEITLAGTPATLRELARFLLLVAEKMEQHGDRFGHEHFEDFVQRSTEDCHVVIVREQC